MVLQSISEEHRSSLMRNGRLHWSQGSARRVSSRFPRGPKKPPGRHRHRVVGASGRGAGMGQRSWRRERFRGLLHAGRVRHMQQMVVCAANHPRRAPFRGGSAASVGRTGTGHRDGSAPGSWLVLRLVYLGCGRRGGGAGRPKEVRSQGPKKHVLKRKEEVGQNDPEIDSVK